MKTTPNSVHMELLNSIPDLVSWNEASQWVEKGQRVLQHLTAADVSQVEIESLEWKDIESVHKEKPFFGLYSSEIWRRFALATFLADVLSYSQPVDQVNFDRLLFVMHAFPQGFRTWWMKCPNQGWWPVGYTGWYPMLETMYQLFEKTPDQLKDRMVVPDPRAINHKPYLYLFNYSVAPILKKSHLSKRMMKQYAEDVKSQKAGGLACITVSEEGARIAQRFGMSRSGFLDLDGCREDIYTGNF